MGKHAPGVAGSSVQVGTITLKRGDFGSDVPVNVGAETLYLPDREHPGLTLAVPVGDVAEMDSINDDGLRPVKQALKIGASGLLTGPRGIAAGFHSVTKVRDVEFEATLNDGRRFVAVTDAKTYANLHAAQLAARTAEMRGGAEEDAPHPADDIIAKYLAEKKLAEPDPAPAEPVSEPTAERRVGERRQTERREQPTFGRRRS
jgi:hypothetical protein